MEKYTIEELKLLIKRLDEGAFINDDGNVYLLSDEEKHLYRLLNELKNSFFENSSQLIKEQDVQKDTNYTKQEYVNKRLNSLISSVMSLAQLDFSQKFEISSNQDDFDGLSIALNMLKEELEQSTVSQDFLNDIFNSMTEMVLVLDSKKDIKWANQSTFNRLGYLKDEFIGKNFNDLISDIKIDELQSKPSSTFSDLHINIQHIHTKRGRIIPVKISISTMSNSHGTVIIANDITERIEAQKLQENLLTNLQDKNEELREFAYMLSHDIKSPLRGIATLSEWVYKDNKEKLSEDSVSNLEMINARVKRLYGFIEGIFKYTKTGKVHVRKEQVSIHELVEELIEILEIPENIKVEIDQQLPTIKIGRVHGIQVFQNLISNAVKYNNKPQGLVNIGCNKRDDYWEFYVKDNGIGIEMRHNDKIFEIFQTLSTKDEFESTGIGLSIVKKIITVYKGDIWLESEKGEGSTFYFHFNIL